MYKLARELMATGGDSHATEEEFENFMVRVTEIGKIVQCLASTDVARQKYGEALADRLLSSKKKDTMEIEETRVTTDRTIINRSRDSTSQDAFKQSVERDARERYENRKVRNERAETCKRIGDSALQRGDYIKAVTHYTKALEQRKDSSILWNDRALAHYRLELYEKAILDCEWALKLDEADPRALVTIAKCHEKLGDDDDSREFLRLARERNPKSTKLIDEYQENLETRMETDLS